MDCVIESAVSGGTRGYLLSVAKSEKMMRDGFAQLKAGAGGTDGLDHTYATLRSVNGFYRTRYSLARLREMAQIVFDSVSSHGWWHIDPPDLLHCAKTEAEPVASFISKTLREISGSGLHHPYSLLTKWMHFCFPESFVIYDWQVASSVQTWSYFAFPLEDDGSAEFAAARIAQPGGTGYRGLVSFYRLCWQAASSDQQEALQTAAQQLSNAIDSHVSVIDVIDKALWNANGDPRKMGLLTHGNPPSSKTACVTAAAVPGGRLS